MATLTVDQIQYNGGTAFTLPTANPSAGQMIKTNASGVLGWRDRLQKASNEAGTVVYNMPTGVTSGKGLGTGGSGTLTWGSLSGDPEAIGNHIGWRLADKIDCNSTCPSRNGTQTIGENAATTLELRLPTSVSPSNVACYQLRAIGMDNQNGTNVVLKPTKQDGSDILSSGTQYMAGQGWGYSTNTFYRYNTNSNEKFGNLNYTAWLPSNNNSGGFNDSTVNQANRRGGSFVMDYYNAKYSPSASFYQWYSTSSSNYYRRFERTGITSGGSGVYASDYTGGFDLTEAGGGKWTRGVVCLYYILNDGA